MLPLSFPFPRLLLTLYTARTEGGLTFEPPKKLLGIAYWLIGLGKASAEVLFEEAFFGFGGVMLSLFGVNNKMVLY